MLYLSKIEGETVNNQNNLTNMDLLDKKEPIIVPQQPTMVSPVEPSPSPVEPLENLNLRQEPVSDPQQVADHLMDPSFQMQQVSKEEGTKIYELEKEVATLNQKLKERTVALSLPAVFILVVVINIGWYIGVKFLIQPKYESSIEISEKLQEEYANVKRKVDAIVGPEE